MAERRWGPVALCAFALLGCEDRSPSDRPSSSGTSHAETPRTETEDTPVAQLWAGPAVDLLHAVPSELRVSSVSRDETDQVEYLVDGDLETAWNSASGDLVGAWIEFVVPEAVRIGELRLTAGYTKRTERRDLFVGNHRVERIRVTQDGDLVVEQNLDVEERGMQTVPIGRSGGRYRVEITGVREGTRRGWREVCVSEFRVAGQADDARPGGFSPTLGVGPADPVPEGEAGSSADDVDSVPAVISWGEAGGPRLAASSRPNCVMQGRGCLEHEGFPAISADGHRLIVLTPRPFLLLGPTAEEMEELVLEIRTVPGGQEVESLTLVDEGDVGRMVDVHSDCCGDAEYDCDPYLCEEDPARVAEVSDSLREKVAETIGEVVGILAQGAPYRSLIPIDGEGSEGLAADVQIADEAVTVTVRSEASTVVDRSLPFNCEACALSHSGVWFDPRTRTVAAMAIGFDGTSEDAGGGWLVTRARTD